jgi:hypothetical protein
MNLLFSKSFFLYTLKLIALDILIALSYTYGKIYAKLHKKKATGKISHLLSPFRVSVYPETGTLLHNTVQLPEKFI